MTPTPAISTEHKTTSPVNLELVTQELTRFDAEVGSWQVPFLTLLLYAEGIASFRLAGLPVQARHVVMAGVDRTLSRDAKLILANARAIETLLDRADGLTGGAVIELHHALSVATPFLPNDGHEVTFDLLRSSELPALVQAALITAQLHSHRPFGFVAGGVGRILAHAVLRARGVTRHATIPLSAGLLAQPPLDGAPTVDRFVLGAGAAVKLGRQLKLAAAELLRDWQARLGEGVRADASSWRMLPLLLTTPAFDAKRMAEGLGVSLKAVYKGIRTLEERGIVRNESSTPRNRYWSAPGVVSVLGVFINRARALSKARR